jgi:acetyltransferase-like isoleucine patch superfamily enzyme
MIHVLRQLFRLFILVATVPMPWSVKRPLLQTFLGYELDPDAKIGLSIVDAHHVKMAKGARVGQMNVIRRLELLEMAEGSHINAFNWISSVPMAANQPSDWGDRKLELKMGVGAEMMYRLVIDCSDSVILHDFVWLAGYRTAIYTHQYRPTQGVMGCAPVEIGEFVFINGACTVAPGSVIGDRAVFAGMSFISGEFEPLKLYGGIPAKEIRDLDPDVPWYDREARSAAFSTFRPRVIGNVPSAMEKPSAPLQNQGPN